MREIEFRGYVPDAQQFIYGYLMPDNTIYQVYEPKKGRCGIGTFSVVPESIGQYTGCRDVNGIKIFENDIVKEVYGSRYYQVVYKENGFRCIHIWDWDDKHKIINSLFKNQKIYARNCEIKEVCKKLLFVIVPFIIGIAEFQTRTGLNFSTSVSHARELTT